MVHTPAPSSEVRNPGPFQASGTLKGSFSVFLLIGVVAFLAGLQSDGPRAWVSFVHNHFYFMSMGLGGLFFAAIQWATNAMWSAPIRRLSEAFTAYLPVALITFVVLIFGMHSLYHWSLPELAKSDPVIALKTGYLNVPFFIVRNVVALLLWIVFARAMVGNSVAQDQTGSFELTKKNRFLSPIFLIVFALTFTMASFDQLMSLDPHWFSTMFGVYCFAGLFYSNLAATCLLTIYFKRKGLLQGIVNDNHLHDLGKFMLSFTIFWAYIGFSQFMLIWYANLPEETGYFMRRMSNGWLWVSIFLLLGKFAVPFFVLLPRGTKRSEKVLAGTAIFMLLSQWIDVMWMVQPEFYLDGPHLGWIEIGVTLGFLGAFGLSVLRFLSKNNIVAIRDPRLSESVFGHHQ